MERRSNVNDTNFLLSQIKKDLEKEFRRKMIRRETSARNINRILDRNISIGERIADQVARVGGSWSFIIGFLIFLVLWMLINVIMLKQNPFDPYPFILLNLCLSCIAALQAPVIMMSQNRQAKKDRLEAEEDFQTNTRSEVQIQEIMAKLDLFMDLYIKDNFSNKEEHFHTIIKKLTEIQETLDQKPGKQ
ncbi:MAG: DUF1003 domain-containing protein [Bacteroidota bacterium]